MRSRLTKFSLILFFLAFFSISQTSNAQFKSYGLKGGAEFNFLVPANEFDYNYDLNFSYLARGFLRFEINDMLSAEAGAGVGLYSGDDYAAIHYNTTIIPIDGRLIITPFNLESVNPYAYAGIGIIHYDVKDKPVSVSPNPVEYDGWTGIVPFGVGMETKLIDGLLLDLHAGVGYALNDYINGYRIEGFNDAYYNAGVGLVFTGENPNSDNDNDGLTKAEEEQIGTDPNNADTDGDGLNDGAEFNKHKTDPLNPDSDGDGLNDYDEVFKYKSNPNKKDTDDDGLNDYDEVTKHKTDPTNPDTDGDGLTDGDEVVQYKTSPFNVDTDSDGLNDGEEVNRYQTNPLKADTDGGTVYDGQEVKNGTDPLNPDDDIMKKEVEEERVFENVLFPFDSYKLTKDEMMKLDNVASELESAKKVSLTLSGYTDNIGPENYNMKLSEKRVNAVKQYLTDKGISESSIDVKWFGESNPAVPNTSKMNRQKNRRVEVKAVVTIEKM